MPKIWFEKTYLVQSKLYLCSFFVGSIFIYIPKYWEANPTHDAYVCLKVEPSKYSQYTLTSRNTFKSCLTQMNFNNFYGDLGSVR